MRQMGDLGKDHLLTCFDLSENRNSSWVNRNQPSYPKPSVINFYFIIFMPIEIKNAGPIKLPMPVNTNSGIIVLTLLGSIERIV